MGGIDSQDSFTGGSSGPARDTWRRHPRAYRHPRLSRALSLQPTWWVFPGFPGLHVHRARLRPRHPGRLPQPLRRTPSRSGGTPGELVEASAFIFVYMMSGFGNARPDLLSAIFYGFFAARWLFTYDRAWLLLRRRNGDWRHGRRGRTGRPWAWWRTATRTFPRALSGWEVSTCMAPSPSARMRCSSTPGRRGADLPAGTRGEKEAYASPFFFLRAPI